MSVKKRVTGLAFVFAMLVVLSTPSSFGVFAESDVSTKGKSIEVELNDDYFNPKVITIPNGTSTTLILKNKGKKEHTFTVEKLGIDAEIQPGKETSISVKPKQPGTYELICRYHFQEGMVGNVIVK
ncbi:cupredoxin domain-containing protein [Cytobacillus firmus]|uniref:cupredoxin domain-containing protein n=1 Tax=Cytobacillus oceanisediminis TaxID=665099 RepID=UPI00203F0D2B|nr:cupredoxin domain-containing protein [Cytobacillus oceanisediminis]MCM3246500.1 cupredoxin domain-containing protein [Cytobacillus oceanisediminis]MCS0827647.1 cupredoxin domain-containing protein [Cytobacillus firmus]